MVVLNYSYTNLLLLLTADYRPSITVWLKNVSICPRNDHIHGNLYCLQCYIKEGPKFRSRTI